MPAHTHIIYISINRLIESSVTDKDNQKMGFRRKKLAQLFFYQEKSCIFVADFELSARLVRDVVWVKSQSEVGRSLRSKFFERAIEENF